MPSLAPVLALALTVTAMTTLCPHVAGATSLPATMQDPTTGTICIQPPSTILGNTILAKPCDALAASGPRGVVQPPLFLAGMTPPTGSSTGSTSAATPLYPTIAPKATTTATATSGSNVITVDNVAGIKVNDNVYGSFVGNGCSTALAAFLPVFVKSISGTTLTLSCPATATAKGAAVQFGQDRYPAGNSLLANTVGARTAFFGPASVGHGNWLGSIISGQEYPLTNTVTVLSNGGAGLVAAARTSEANGGAVPMGLGVYFYADKWYSPAPHGGYAINMQSNLSEPTGKVGEKQIHVQQENTINSLWPSTIVDPFNINQENETSFVRYDCGSGQDNVGTPQYAPVGAGRPKNCSDAIEISHNGGQVNAGIVIVSGALDKTAGVGGMGRVISMPSGDGLEWLSAHNKLLARIYGIMDSGENPVFLNESLSNGTITYKFGGPSVLNINRVATYPSASGVYDVGAKNLKFAHVYANNFVETLTTPASSSAPCTAGQFTDDQNYHYVCVATNTWKRVALTGF